MPDRTDSSPISASATAALQNAISKDSTLKDNVRFLIRGEDGTVFVSELQRKMQQFTGCIQPASDDIDGGMLLEQLNNSLSQLSREGVREYLLHTEERQEHAESTEEYMAVALVAIFANITILSGGDYGGYSAVRTRRMMDARSFVSSYVHLMSSTKIRERDVGSSLMQAFIRKNGCIPKQLEGF